MALACWTYGASFAFFGAERTRQVMRGLEDAVRNLLPLAVAAAAIAVAYWLLSLLAGLQLPSGISPCFVSDTEATQAGDARIGLARFQCGAVAGALGGAAGAAAADDLRDFVARLARVSEIV